MRINKPYHGMVLTSLIRQLIWCANCGLCLCMCLLLPLSLPGQTETKDWTVIDRKARRTPRHMAQSIPQLVGHLTEGLTGEQEKLRSLYSWIVSHIQFDVKAYKKGNKRLNHGIDDIMRRRKAVCFGYSQLMKRFCEEAGIRCEIVSGYVEPTDFQAPNHAWNAVLVDGQWALLDVTWESNSHHQGYHMDEQKQTHKGYFLPPARYFLKEHLPANPLWQLLEHPIEWKEFRTYQPNIPLDSSRYYHLQDSLKHHFRQPPLRRKMLNAESEYRYNPSAANKRELAATYMDVETILSRQLEDHPPQSSDSVLQMQRQLVQLCRKAGRLDDLFDNQREGCLLNSLNLAIAIENRINQEEGSPTAAAIDSLRSEQKRELEWALEALSSLPDNPIRQAIRQNCQQLLESIGQ